MTNSKLLLMMLLISSSLFVAGCIDKELNAEQIEENMQPKQDSIEDFNEVATSSISIRIESSSENITIYIPVLLDENKTLLKMYENPEITGNVSTAVIDTEYGKALMISQIGVRKYMFNWNEIPGKDTDLFVKWIEGIGYVRPGEKPDISKTEDGRTITVTGRRTLTGRITTIYKLNEKGVLEFYIVDNKKINEISGVGLFFAKEENGKLNLYSGNYEIDIDEKHEILKEDTQTSDEFLKGLTISMSNHTSLKPLSEIDAWVYSDSDVEKISFYFELDPQTHSDRESLVIDTYGRVNLRKGWQMVNLSVNRIVWD